MSALRSIVVTRFLVYIYVRLGITKVLVRLSIDPVILIVMSVFIQASMSKIQRLLKPLQQFSGT